MQASERVEQALERAVARGRGTRRAAPCWPRRCAMRCFPAAIASGRRLVLAVAARLRRRAIPSAADAAAAAIELLHCASLVHDDLPASTTPTSGAASRRCMSQFGEPIAVLTGDALIVLAFETLARVLDRKPRQLARLTRNRRARRSARRAASSPDRPGNARPPCRWSTTSAPRPARCSSARRWPAPRRPASNREPWRALGAAIGEAYQVADDLRDVLCDAEELGKPIGQDAARLRPNAAAQLGVGGAKARLSALVDAAAAAIPHCPGAAELRTAIRAADQAFFPKQLARFAA